MKYVATGARGEYACGARARTCRTNKRGMRPLTHLSLAHAFPSRSPTFSLPSLPSIPAALPPPFALSLLLSFSRTPSFSLSAYTRVRVYACVSMIARTRRTAHTYATGRARVHAAPSSSSSAPLGRAHKSEGKREGTIFFRMGYLTHWPGQ